MQVKATIITECLPLLDAELEKLNRKAKKLGCNPFTVTKSEPYMRAQDVNGANQVDDVVDVVIDGEPIKMDGWRYIGRIEAVPPSLTAPQGGDNLIFPVRGETAPEQFRKSNPYACNHCNQNRQRKATWIMQHDDGAYKQIGSSCLSEFFTSTNPERAITWWMGSIDKLMAYLADLAAKSSKQVVHGTLQPYQPILVSAKQVLRLACQDVRMRGKYDFGDNGSRSTSEVVWDGVFRTDARTAFYTQAPNQDDDELADKIIDFVMARRAGSDYFRNLSIMFLNDKVQARNVRYICSVVYAWRKEQGLLGRKGAVNEHVGKVDERLRDLKLKVVFTLGLPSQWHESYDWLVILEDVQGRTFKWKKTSAGILNKGDWLTVTGTVKAHEIYKGTKQTVLTRCSVKAEKVEA